MSIDASSHKDVRILARNQAAWMLILDSDPRGFQVDQYAWQETHALIINCQAPMINNENFYQIVVFNGVVGAVESSGNYTNQTAVASSLVFGSIVDCCSELMM